MDVNANRQGQSTFAMEMKKDPMVPVVHRFVRKLFLLSFEQGMENRIYIELFHIFVTDFEK